MPGPTQEVLFPAESVSVSRAPQKKSLTVQILQLLACS